MKTLFIMALCPILALSACADIGAKYQPILDGAPSASFQPDLQACQNLARDQRQLDQQTMGSAAAGGALGAAVAANDKGGTAIEGLVGGALVGLFGGVTKSKEKRERIIQDCMKGRGHSIVG
ncbi:MAG: glycine zipper family protein [Cypionkella sp.]